MKGKSSSYSWQHKLWSGDKVKWNVSTDTTQLHRWMKKKILPEAVWPHRLVDAFRLLCYISAAGFQEEMRDETTARLCAVSLCPSLLNHLLFLTSAWRICGLLNPPTNQSRRQQALQTLLRQTHCSALPLWGDTASPELSFCGDLM